MGYGELRFSPPLIVGQIQRGEGPFCDPGTLARLMALGAETRH